MSKALASRLKETISDLISCQQSAYVKNKFVGEREADLYQIYQKSSNVFNLRGCIVTIDIEKALDSLNYSFLLACLKKIGFGHDFIR